MIKKYPPINPKMPRFIHGADYNPEQWSATPEIWDEDMRLMKLANCNEMSIGIFSWAALEPEEGQFDFSFLDTTMDNLAKNGGVAVLATPSGARPAWLSEKYPEVLRTNANRVKMLHGERHNHCFTSPVYREKTQKLNTLLAQRYKDHSALLVWHVSNEYGGECHCDLCQDAFRQWLKNKYDNDLDRLNHQWWTGFWSHTYTSWAQIVSPSAIGEFSIQGLALDWKRFVTHQTTDFMKNEIAPLKAITPNVPVTANFMGTYPGLDYWKMKDHVDVISWDNYPTWHSEKSDAKIASEIGFVHDINRCLKGGKPFMLMESTPSLVNWAPINKLKKPGMHVLSSLQAVAHGADSVQYFQWRKSRGATEKFHGAVVDHCGHEHTRVFRDVQDVGAILKKLDDVIGTTVRPETAIIFDWDNRWAFEELYGLNRQKRDYEAVCKTAYEAFWKKGVPVDVIDSEQDFSSYKLVAAPLLYMVKPGVAERLEAFVKNGGTVVCTYFSGIVNENDLCFLGGFPGPLKNMLGIWAEEIDSLYDHESIGVSVFDGHLGLAADYQAKHYCDLIHAESAKVLAEYTQDFYAGYPALTVNQFGKGQAYYIAFRDEGCFTHDFYGALIEKLGLEKALNATLPEGVTAQKRGDGERDFIFLQNYNAAPVKVDVGGQVFGDVLTGEAVTGVVELERYGVRILIK